MNIPSGVLLADEQGLGKTVESIGVINALGDKARKILVVCPESLRVNWERELSRWMVRPLSIGIATSREFPDDTHIVIIGYASLQKHPQIAGPWDVAIVDECTAIKNSKAKRTKAFKSIKANYRMALTGTPAPNRLSEIFNVLNWLAPHLYPSWWRFIHQYCGACSGFGGHLEPDGPGANPEALQKDLRSNLMIRRLKADVLPELPPKRRSIIEFEIPKHLILKEHEAHQRLLDSVASFRAEAALAEASEDEEDYRRAVDKLRRAQVVGFEEMSTVSRQIGIASIPFALEHLESCQAKTVVFCHHREVIESLARQLPNSVIHYGGMDDQDKQLSVDQFQGDPSVKYFIGSISASGLGLTLTASSHVVFIEEPWVPGLVYQCEDRCHRIGTKESVLVQHLIAAGSISARKMKVMLAKQSLIDRALDKDRDRLMWEPVFGDEPEKPSKVFPIPEPDKIAAIHECLKILSSVCDGARTVDGSGFSKVDVFIGKSLAARQWLTPKQAGVGMILVRKYRRQLPEELTKGLCASVHAEGQDR